MEIAAYSERPLRTNPLNKNNFVKTPHRYAVGYESGHTYEDGVKVYNKDYSTGDNNLFQYDVTTIEAGGQTLTFTTTSKHSFEKIEKLLNKKKLPKEPINHSSITTLIKNNDKRNIVNLFELKSNKNISENSLNPPKTFKNSKKLSSLINQNENSLDKVVSIKTNKKPSKENSILYLYQLNKTKRKTTIPEIRSAANSDGQKSDTKNYKKDEKTGRYQRKDGYHSSYI